MSKHKNFPMNMYIGLKIKRRRILLGLTLSDIACHIGVTFQQIQKYETGINNISASQLYKISNILKIDIDYFYPQYKNSIKIV